MNNFIKNNIAWVGSTICVLLITVVLIIIFSQSTNGVVEDKSSTTFSYTKEQEKEFMINKAVIEDVLKEYPYIQNLNDDKKEYQEMKKEITKLEAENKKKQAEEIKVIIQNKLKQKRLEEERQKRIAEEKRKIEREKALALQTQKKKKQQVISRGSSNVVRSVNVVATAYTSYCSTGCVGITATGVNVQNSITYNGQAIIAVDPSIIPLHSIVKVHPNDRPAFLATAMDTGGDIKGHRIDYLISVNNTSKAFDFGKQTVRVDILREGKGK
jgi:3D (Asp-Asp-Asp) domain-containing protein